ncbi:hypothetical protein Pstr01_29620 [Pseudomonas straminea]|uniref:Uncharacterized protein n=1 Tax=Pseudomonas straminea TaxID=47882 RepID=A0A1I1WG95_PSEOC|nr:hypothetical protein [Pseudomonas straminea]GLX14723.1 hypothetical protein Pstr01_29620 [Pseudomonas straminea]SFD92110.1 hypothetical protein SAMN05216372_105359 [Pseudomonas straminea]
MELMSDVIANDPVIEQLLRAWLGAVQRYTHLFKSEDCCWWYNERTSVSVLAGAAWTLGWAALEECPTEKHPPSYSGVEADCPIRRGRIDLYISTDREELTFEAKQVWQKLPGVDKVSEGRNGARNAALDIPAHTTDRLFAATFVIPFFAESDIKDGDTDLTAWVSNQLELLGGSLESCAYYFPRLESGQLKNVADFIYPGVMLIIEELTGSPAA